MNEAFTYTRCPCVVPEKPRPGLLGSADCWLLAKVETAVARSSPAVPLTVTGGQLGVLQGERRWWPVSVVYLAGGVPRLVVGTVLIAWRPTTFAAMLGVAMRGPDHLEEFVTTLFRAPLRAQVGPMVHGLNMIPGPAGLAVELSQQRVGVAAGLVDERTQGMPLQAGPQ